MFINFKPIFYLPIMSDTIELRKLYDDTRESFPEEEHDEDRFVRCIISVLEKDALRTSGLRKEISSLGLNYLIHRVFPLNDFGLGVYEYLINAGVKKVVAIRTSEELTNKENLFKS